MCRLSSNEGRTGFFFKQRTAYEMRISDWSSAWLFRSDDVVEEVAVVADQRQGAGVVGEQFLEQLQRPHEIGRASCRERVCQYVSISGVAETLKKKAGANTTRFIGHVR